MLNFKYQFRPPTIMLVALTGTMIGFGAFGYSIVKLKDRQWREAAIAMVGGAAVLSIVGWNLNRLKDDATKVFGADYMKRTEVEKVLDESRGKIVGVTFIKKDGSERTLVGRIGKRYSPTGTDPLGGKAARRGRGLFTIYDMQKQAFRMVNMDTVISIRAGGKTYRA